MKKQFFIITQDRYPNGDAGAIRIHSFAKILENLGYEPIVIGLGKITKFKCEKYDGIDYYSLRYSNNNKILRAIGRIFYKTNLIKIIKKYNYNNINGILYVSGGKNVISWLKKIGLKNNIKLYFDSVEWYSPSEFKFSKYSYVYKFNDNLNKKYIDKQFNVIAISKYLESYFKSKNINTIRIPVIMDIKNINYVSKLSKDYIKIVYAGQIGGKDKISNFVFALDKLTNNELKKIKMYIIGINQEDFENKFGKVNQKFINKNLFFTGRISRNEVLKHLETADFTMLVRPSYERYAKAGFPTKVVESLATGTPVICNYTSDLSLYLKDGYNSVIIKDESLDSCKDGLIRTLKYNKEQLSKMTINARKTAEDNFDWQIYVSKFKKYSNNEE